MADSPSSHAAQSNPQQPESEAPETRTNQLDPVQASTPPTAEPQSSTPSSAVNPNLHHPLASAPQPPTISYPPTQVFAGAVVPPAAPSFRPVSMQTPQFSPLPNYQNPGVQPPGVGSTGAGVVPVSMSHGQMQPMMPFQVPPGHLPNPALRQYAPIPNGYTTIHGAPQGTMPPQVYLR